MPCSARVATRGLTRRTRTGCSMTAPTWARSCWSIYLRRHRGGPAARALSGRSKTRTMDDPRNAEEDPAGRVVVVGPDGIATDGGPAEPGGERPEDGLATELVDELERLSLPFAEDEVPSEAELRVAQAQLVGWLEGLFHGIQTTLFAQQMAARAQLEQMRRALPPGMIPAQDDLQQQQPGPRASGPYL